jgi:hypothetical protein
MKLSELPQLIKEQALKVQELAEERDYFLTTKKEKDIEIERKVQSLDPKVIKNENQREVARFDFRDEDYDGLLGAIIYVESELAKSKIELQYLRDEFAVAKIENQGQIAAAYV